MVLGLGAAVLAACCYGVASVVQAVGVRRALGVPRAAPLLTRLLAGRWYGAGLALDALGFLASLAALRVLPLFLVQTTVASSVGITALLAAAFLGARLTRARVVALVALVTGLVALGTSAPAGTSRGLPGSGGLLLLGGVVPLVLVTFAAMHRRAGWCFPALAVASGLGFAGVAISARVLVLPDPLWRALAEAPLWALAGYGVQSTVGYASALAKGSVTTATALALLAETVVPGAVGLAFLGDRVRSGFGVVALAGFVLALGGCLRLAGSAPPA
jgi:hypothetical protein